MATESQIDTFRLLIGNPPNEDPYTDTQLGARLDAATSPEALAASIWREKAAEYSGLVDVSESGSSRSLSQLSKNALIMAASFDAQVPDDSASQRGVRVSRLTRS